MSAITPCLWFDGQIEEAAQFYASTFDNGKVGTISRYADAGKEIHGHNAGDPLTVNLHIEDMDFMLLNGGPNFQLNPSISFFVRTQDRAKVDRLWEKLSDGGQVLMQLDAYPFSEHYGWVQDKYGVSWQIILVPNEPAQIIAPSLLFTQDNTGRAEDAMNFYLSIFPNSAPNTVNKYPAGMEPDKEGTIAYADFTILGEQLVVMDSARDHQFTFSEAVSLTVTVETQEEIDRYWEQLSAVPEAEQCGWLKDKFGVSWQIVPTLMDEMQRNGTPEQLERVMAAFMPMKKFDIATLQAAYDQA